MKSFLKISLFFLILFTACQKPDSYFEGNAVLRFSEDTIVFDTVFTSIGSITKRLKIYNDLNEDLEIDEIKLARMGNTSFRLNIDGLQSDVSTNVILRAKDSLHIFIETTIDPNNVNEPLIHTDSIQFTINGNIQDVDLVAWGQDANFYYNNAYFLFENSDPEIIYDTLFYYSINTAISWTNDKPHVIYGNVIVHEGGSLNIGPGSQVHLHNNSNIIVLEGSSLKILGEQSSPVLVAGDRLDDYYKNLPGQWGRIWLTGKSFDNQIENAHIKNGTIGIMVDTVLNSFDPTLRIKNTKISNHSSYGLLAYSSFIEASNCQFNDNGAHDLYLFAGGKYRFSHCTFANYSYSHQSPSLRMSNFYEDVNGNEILRPMAQADFENCIIYGNMESEIAIERSENTSFNYQFNHCLLKLKESDFDLSNNLYFVSNDYNESPKFIYTFEDYVFDYELGEESPAQHSAAQDIALQFPNDFNGNSRLNDQGPDKGAFERME
tara:strand:+ start:3709 stop:5181 length:1473 start_codon:yes stop_codon:yes gene_type:complete